MAAAQPAPAQSLCDVLAALDRIAAKADRLTVRDILGEIGNRSFAAILLVPALILVSPVSAIPGTPTVSALIVILITLQWLFGRDHLWLPDFIMERSIASRQIARAVAWLRRPSRWVDRHSHQRLVFLTGGPLSVLPLVVVLAIAATWPMLELLPMVTSIGAFAVALFAFGMMTRDGLWIALGYAFVGLLVTVARLVI